MEARDVTVVYSSLRSNLLNLPPELVSVLYGANINVQNVVVELSWKPKKRKTVQYAYAGWSGMTSVSKSGRQTVEMDPVFAASLDVPELSKINIGFCFNVPEAYQIHLEPVTFSDWETVELHAQYLENRLLNQSRAVTVGQTLVVYPSKTVTANLKVVAIEPSAKFAKISPSCEVIIAPKVRNERKDSSSSESTSIAVTQGSKTYLRNVCLPNSVIPYDVSNDSMTVVVNPGVKVDKLVKLSKLELETDPVDAKSVVVKVLKSKKVPPEFVGITRMVGQCLEIVHSNRNMLLLENPIGLSRPRKITVHRYITKTQDRSLCLNEEQKSKLEPEFESYLHKILLNEPISNGRQLPVHPEFLPMGGMVQFKQNDSNCWTFYENLEDLSFDLGKDVVRKESEVDKVCENYIENTKISLNESKEALIGYDDLRNAILDDLQTDINGVLVFGASGSGKSLLVRNIIKEKFSNTLDKLVLLDMKSHINESGNLEALKKTFNRFFSKAICYENVILVIEDIHIVCYKESEQAFSDNSLTNNFTEFFINKFFEISKSANLKLLLTAKSKDGLNKKLLANSLFINKTHKIEAPDKTQREQLLTYLLQNKQTKMHDKQIIEFNDVVGDTEGFLPNDLKILVERTHHNVVFDYISSNKALTNPLIAEHRHFQKALKGYTPSGLRNIKLQSSKVKWDEVGGLTKAKEILLETLEWPTKYAPIFANCPLRLRSGILLYGYPGCGKTFLASAIAAQCGLNFISIKGPEILNKYIGASEQSVRELFNRAQAAKPCILFFDEFDSIAPKRGHDATGVTDRVVNQMLTQMDGAEGLDGVYVLAATSRPDLIDSALLRPGRLDKSVICDMPDLEDRLDILKTVAKDMKLSSNIDLRDIVKDCEGFSGADLQALCYNAYLNAVHRKLQDDAKKNESADTDNESNGKSDHNNISAYEFLQFKDSKKIHDLPVQEKMELISKITTLNKKSLQNTKTNKESFTICIELEDFVHARQETSSSISAKERQKLQKIYREFVADRDGNMPDGSASNKIGGRTSLM